MILYEKALVGSGLDHLSGGSDYSVLLSLAMAALLGMRLVEEVAQVCIDRHFPADGEARSIVRTEDPAWTAHPNFNT